MTRLISAFFLSTFTPPILCAALVIYLPFDQGDMLIWAGLLLPIIWVTFVIYSYSAANKWHPLFVLMTVLVTTAGLVALLWSGMVAL